MDNKFKTVTYELEQTVEEMENSNVRVIVKGSCMMKDLSDLAKNLSKQFRWVHIYNQARQYDFSWNNKIGYTQWKECKIIK